MSRASTSALRDGVLLNNRYRIVKQIGRGGFGRAYLAEDTQRYREYCVLKEFAPQVKSDRELRQAEDLFEREAGILYKLRHSQIPRFEALLRTRINGRRSLFLVQEYIEGESYWKLLRRRGRLTEAEVSKMIQEVLPVLDYIHAAGLIHRDISPDNLILRDRDRETVLIDFGCVKLAANAVSQSTGNLVTLIGKKGYSPNEQLYHGETAKCSDLYSLAATAIVLLTGKQPDKLYDSHKKQWDWKQIKISPSLKKILAKMLQDRPGDRYQSVSEIPLISSKAENSALDSFISRIRTVIIAPGDDESQGSSTSNSFSFASGITSGIGWLTQKTANVTAVFSFSKVQPWHWGMVVAGAILIPGLISFATINSKIGTKFTFDLLRNSENSNPSRTELELQRKIQRKIDSLNLDPSSFYSEVDRVFHSKYPELAGVRLTEGDKHQHHREIWYQIADTLLKEREQHQ